MVQQSESKFAHRLISIPRQLAVLEIEAARSDACTPNIPPRVERSFFPPWEEVPSVSRCEYLAAFKAILRLHSFCVVQLRVIQPVVNNKRINRFSNKRTEMWSFPRLAAVSLKYDVAGCVRLQYGSTLFCSQIDPRSQKTPKLSEISFLFSKNCPAYATRCPTYPIIPH